MAANMPGYSTSWLGRPEMGKAVTGYTGTMAGLKADVGTVFGKSGPVDEGEPESFFNHGGAGSPPAALVQSFAAAKDAQTQRASTSVYRVPGYAGHMSGHKHIAGKSNGAISTGEGGRTDFPNFGEGAPGMQTGDRSMVSGNLLPGDQNPSNPLPRSKRGYTGHLPGRHYSTNFGKSFHMEAQELLKYNGRPPAGGIADPGRPYIADTESCLQFPEGNIGRPQRSLNCVSGYSGFRPRTTPLPY